MPRASYSLSTISTITWFERPSHWMKNGRYAGDGNQLFVSYVWISATALLFFGIIVAVGSFTFAWKTFDFVFLGNTWQTMLGLILVFLSSLIAVATAILMAVANRTKGKEFIIIQILLISGLVLLTCGLCQLNVTNGYFWTTEGENNFTTIIERSFENPGTRQTWMMFKERYNCCMIKRNEISRRIVTELNTYPDNETFNFKNDKCTVQQVYDLRLCFDVVAVMMKNLMKNSYLISWLLLTNFIVAEIICIIGGCFLRDILVRPLRPPYFMKRENSIIDGVEIRSAY